jgi:hypothetical protein
MLGSLSHAGAGVRSSEALCAKKHSLRLHLPPSWQSSVL